MPWQSMLVEKVSMWIPKEWYDRPVSDRKFNRIRRYLAYRCDLCGNYLLDGPPTGWMVLSVPQQCRWPLFKRTSKIVPTTSSMKQPCFNAQTLKSRHWATGGRPFASTNPPAKLKGLAAYHARPRLRAERALQRRHTYMRHRHNIICTHCNHNDRAIECAVEKQTVRTSRRRIAWAPW